MACRGVQMSCCVPSCKTFVSDRRIRRRPGRGGSHFARAAAVYQTLERPMPPIFPRISATLIEPRIAYPGQVRLDLEDVFRGRDTLRKMAAQLKTTVRSTA